MKRNAVLPLVTALLVSSLPLGAGAAGTAGLDDLGTGCLDTQLQNCRVLTAGFINVEGSNDEGAPMLAWQTQAGFTYEDGVLGGFVLFEYADDGWRVLDARFEGWRYDPPVYHSETGIVHVAGYSGGTGAGNVDRLYQWGDLGYALYREGWREIEMHGWLTTIGDLLPDGLEIWKGVAYDFRNPWSGLFARTPLWRASDGNCCPTGGDATIVLEIEGDRLVAIDVRYLPLAGD